VDGIVLVVAADHTPRALLEGALDIVDPTKLVGLVFNGFDHLLSGRYAHHYSQYYGQTPTDARKGALTRMTDRVGSLLSRGDAAVKNRRARDRSR